MIRYKKLDERRWNGISKAAKSFRQLTGVNFSTPIPIVSIKNTLDGGMIKKIVSRSTSFGSKQLDDGAIIETDHDADTIFLLSDFFHQHT